jgi:allophanate hydrolase
MSFDLDAGLGFDRLRAAYAAGTRPAEVVEAILARLAARGDDATWIGGPLADRARAAARRLESVHPATAPLWGLPFAVKDNIDVGGVPTTAACPGFDRRPAESATVVARLEAAGAVLIGKTNLDQFATGLSGCRSPYGVPPNALAPGMIPGGSSSGSATAVSAGLVSFSLGTDTAGSGRVPAMLQNLVGLKPTRGVVSARGVVPACRTLDCVSVFALSCADAGEALAAAEGFDPADPYARPRGPAAPAVATLGVPDPSGLEFYGDRAAAALFAAAVERAAALGLAVETVDVAPFLEAARLLYEGPWVAERTAAIREIVETRPEILHPVIREIVGGGLRPSAVDAFAAGYRLAELRRATEAVWARIDALMLPTAPTACTVEAMLADPIRLNARMGHYTNFMNLLDLCGLAVPAGFLPTGAGFGVTLVAPAFAEAPLLALGDALHRAAGTGSGAARRPVEGAPVAPPARFAVVVCGAHMRGLPLSPQLAALGGRFVREAETTPDYRLFALPGAGVARPGLVRAEPGAAVAVEVWDMPSEAVGALLASIPAPLGLGPVRLSDGTTPTGFLCEAAATAGARDVTAFGGWRAFLSAAG